MNLQRNIPSYESFIINESMQIFNEISILDGKKRVLEALSNSPFVLDEEKILAEAILETNQWNSLFDGSLNEASLADRIKEKAQKAKEIIKQKGKDYLSATQEMILKMGGTIKSVIEKILGVIKGFLEKAWAWIKAEVENGYAKAKDGIVKSAAGKFKGKADVAKKEVSNLSSMAKGAVQWCTGGAVGEMKGGLGDAAEVSESFIMAFENSLYFAVAEMIEEDQSFVESLKSDELFEGEGKGVKIPFLSTLAHKVAEFQPFKKLHDVEHAAGDAANKGLNKISEVLSKVAKAPGPFEFTVVGAVFALITGYAIKAGVTSIIKEIGTTAIGAAVATAIPGIGVVLLCMKYTAKGIWCVGVCEEAISLVKGGDKKEEPKEEPKDKTEEPKQTQEEE